MKADEEINPKRKPSGSGAVNSFMLGMTSGSRRAAVANKRFSLNVCGIPR
jgi:hypothetical protein